MKKVAPYSCKTPCKNCPYRKDAPLQLWHKEEFKKLLESDNDTMGTFYGCHKNNGSVCVGWLMMQDKNRIPSIVLRISLSKHNITRKYMDALHCKTEMFETTEEMVMANFPELIINNNQ